jgi:hypothetical protein
MGALALVFRLVGRPLCLAIGFLDLGGCEFKLMPGACKFKLEPEEGAVNLYWGLKRGLRGSILMSLLGRADSG